jgi:transposase-like protein
MQQSSFATFQSTDGGYSDGNYKDPEWLRYQYWDRGQSMRDMSELADVSVRTIEVWMDKHGIETRRHGRPTDGDTEPLKNKNWLTRRYWYDGMSARDIAGHLGVSYYAVLDWMDKGGIERRHCGAYSYVPRNRLDYGPGWDRETKERVRNRDGRQCVDCGLSDDTHQKQYGCALHVHHLIPARGATNPAVYNAERNLVTLCASCHEYREKDDATEPQRSS